MRFRGVATQTNLHLPQGATAKGLVAAAGVEIGVRGSGSINLSSGRVNPVKEGERHSGHSLKFRTQGCLIPPVGNIVQVNMEFPVDWVLVVEKDVRTLTLRLFVDAWLTWTVAGCLSGSMHSGIAGTPAARQGHARHRARLEACAAGIYS